MSTRWNSSINGKFKTAYKATQKTMQKKIIDKLQNVPSANMKVFSHEN